MSSFLATAMAEPTALESDSSLRPRSFLIFSTHGDRGPLPGNRLAGTPPYLTGVIGVVGERPDDGSGGSPLLLCHGRESSASDAASVVRVGLLLLSRQ